MKFLKPKPSPEPIIFKGRKTMPTIPLDDPRFVYRNKDNTDLAATFRAARERLQAGAA